MKNYLFTLLLLCFACINAFAHDVQDSSGKENLLDVKLCFGVGTGSHSQFFEGGYYSYDDYKFKLMPITSYSGTYSFSGRLSSMNRISLGVAVAYENEKGITQVKSSSLTDPHKSGEFRRNVYTFALEFLIKYASYERQLVNFYGYFGGGISYVNEVQRYSLEYYSSNYENGVNSLGSNMEVSWDRKKSRVQICPLGISVGQSVSGFLEVGYGYKGIVNVGIATKIGAK